MEPSACATFNARILDCARITPSCANNQMSQSGSGRFASTIKMLSDTSQWVPAFDHFFAGFNILKQVCWLVMATNTHSNTHIPATTQDEKETWHDLQLIPTWSPVCWRPASRQVYMLRADSHQSNIQHKHLQSPTITYLTNE